LWVRGGGFDELLLVKNERAFETWFQYAWSIWESGLLRHDRMNIWNATTTTNKHCIIHITS
jgi:hypothetical protein